MAVSMVMVLALSACGSAGNYRDPCTQSAQCGAGLECVPSMVMTGSTCGMQGSTCLKRCTTNADCSSLGATATCATDCASNKLCVRL